MTEPVYTVCDKNARGGRPRIHEGRSGRSYPLYADQPTEMPRSDALSFLRDPSFVVRDEANRVLNPLPPAEAAGVRKVVDLGEDECIARYDELTTPALQARVGTRPGGEVFGLEATRDELIAFLTKAPMVRAAAPGEAARSTGDEEDSQIAYKDAAVQNAVTRLPSLEAQLGGL